MPTSTWNKLFLVRNCYQVSSLCGHDLLKFQFRLSLRGSQEHGAALCGPEHGRVECHAPRSVAPHAGHSQRRELLSDALNLIFKSKTLTRGASCARNKKGHAWDNFVAYCGLTYDLLFDLMRSQAFIFSLYFHLHLHHGHQHIDSALPPTNPSQG